LKTAPTTTPIESVGPIANDALNASTSRKGAGYPSNTEANWIKITHDQELEAHDIQLSPAHGESARSSYEIEPAAIAAIILAIVILMVVIAIFIYVRKYKKDFLANQAIVRFRRPNDHTLENEDSVRVDDLSGSVDETIIADEPDDDNNNVNNVKSNKNVGFVAMEDKEGNDVKSATVASDEPHPGENRLKKMVGDYREKLKMSRKKSDSMTVPLDTTVPLDDTLIEDQTWHTSIRDVPIRQATRSPAVLTISNRTEFNSPTVQPANPPRTILKIFGEPADTTNNDAACSDSEFYSDFGRPSKNVLFPYLTATPSESEDDCGSLITDSSEGPEENRLLT